MATTDLYAGLLAELERLRQHLVGCASCSTCESTAGYHALRAVAEIASTWSALAPPDDWGDTPGDAVLADSGRHLLGVIAEKLGVPVEESGHA